MNLSRSMELCAEPVLQASAELGEGAIWDFDESVLHWVDIDKFLLHRFDPSNGKDSHISVGTYIGTVVKCRKENGGGFVVGLPEKIAHVSADGNVNVICELEAGLGNRLNDGKCDPAGRFWCGSMNFEFKPKAGNLWMLDNQRKLHHKLADVTCSNGLVWTRDAKLMYYIDTMTGHLDCFDYDIETGEIRNRRIAVKNQWPGHFDGMTIDAEDNVYIAIWEGSAVRKINPKTGALLATIKVPGVKNVTSCAFGGPTLSDLYITSSAKGSDPKNEPNAGALFKITLPNTQGLPAFEYRG